MSLQGLELLVTVLLARSRQPPPTFAAGAPHVQFTAELLSLPSGLLAMVCEAIVKLKVRLGDVRVGRLHGRWERADEVPAHARRLVEYWGQSSPLGVVGAYAECLQYCE